MDENCIWLIFESDAYMTYTTYSIKMITTDANLARQEFDRLAILYNKNNPDCWLLNLATHDPISQVRLDGNVLADLRVISTSEDFLDNC